MNFPKLIIASVCATSLSAGAVLAGSTDDAAKLGTSLTPVGANPNANSDGSIPAWNPNGPKVPAGFDPSTGVYPDPYKGEQKIFSIDASNMDQHADNLTEGTKAMLRQFGDDFRVDVYPSHRDFVPADWIVDNTKHNAEKTTITEDGLKVEGSLPGFPFPVPENGIEAIWNHLSKPLSSHEIVYNSYYVTSSGEPILSTNANAYVWAESFEEGNRHKPAGDTSRMKLRIDYNEPARRAGEKLLMHEPGADYSQSKGRKAWQYLTGQRRVRLAPAVAFDTPNPGVAGTSTYDDASVYNGSPERYNWTLVGKKEMYIPYNNYDFVFSTPVEEALGKKSLDPDHIRWEKHRVWVVEADLKDGKRHIYKKRRFYLDEDTWAAVASDAYDSRGDLWRVQLMFPTILWDKGTAYTLAYSGHDLLQGNYNVNGKPIPGGLRFTNSKKPRFYSPKGLTRGGIR